MTTNADDCNTYLYIIIIIILATNAFSMARLVIVPQSVVTVRSHWPRRPSRLWDATPPQARWPMACYALLTRSQPAASTETHEEVLHIRFYFILNPVIYISSKTLLITTLQFMSICAYSQP